MRKTLSIIASLIIASSGSNSQRNIRDYVPCKGFEHFKELLLKDIEDWSNNVKLETVESKKKQFDEWLRITAKYYLRKMIDGEPTCNDDKEFKKEGNRKLENFLASDDFKAIKQRALGTVDDLVSCLSTIKNVKDGLVLGESVDIGKILTDFPNMKSKCPQLDDELDKFEALVATNGCRAIQDLELLLKDRIEELGEDVKEGELDLRKADFVHKNTESFRSEVSQKIQSDPTCKYNNGQYDVIVSYEMFAKTDKFREIMDKVWKEREKNVKILKGCLRERDRLRSELNREPDETKEALLTKIRPSIRIIRSRCPKLDGDLAVLAGRIQCKEIDFFKDWLEDNITALRNVVRIEDMNRGQFDAKVGEFAMDKLKRMIAYDSTCNDGTRQEPKNEEWVSYFDGLAKLIDQVWIARNGNSKRLRKCLSSHIEEDGRCPELTVVPDVIDRCQRFYHNKKYLKITIGKWGQYIREDSIDRDEFYKRVKSYSDNFLGDMIGNGCIKGDIEEYWNSYFIQLKPYIDNVWNERKEALLAMRKETKIGTYCSKAIKAFRGGFETALSLPPKRDEHEVLTSEIEKFLKMDPLVPSTCPSWNRMIQELEKKHPQSIWTTIGSYLPSW